MCTSQEAKEEEKIRTKCCFPQWQRQEGQLSEEEKNINLSDISSDSDWTSDNGE